MSNPYIKDEREEMLLSDEINDFEEGFLEGYCESI